MDIFIDNHNDELNQNYLERKKETLKKKQKLIDEYNRYDSYDYKIKIFRQTVKIWKNGFWWYENVGYSGGIIPYDEDETFGGNAKFYNE